MQIFKLVTLILIMVLVGCKKDNHDDNPVQPQPVDTWVKTYADLGNPAGDVIQTFDGGYAVAAGNTSSGLLRLDSRGDSLWYAELSGSIYVTVSSVIQTRAGDFVLAGSDFSSGHDIYAAKVSSSGGVLWERRYNRVSGTDWGSDVVESGTGDFLICGQIGERFGLLAIGSNGDSLWERTVSDTVHSGATAIAQARSGNFVVVGWSNSVGRPALVLTISPFGEFGWQRALSDSFGMVPSDVKPLYDGSVVIVGSSDAHQAWASKLSQEGIPEWFHTYGEVNSGGAAAIVEADDGSFVVVGQTVMDIWLFQLIGNGEMHWSRNYLTSQGEYGTGLTRCSDGGYVLSAVADTYSLTHDLLLIKVDQNGEL